MICARSMFVAEHDGTGWSHGQLRTYAPLQMHPAAQVARPLLRLSMFPALPSYYRCSPTFGSAVVIIKHKMKHN